MNGSGTGLVVHDYAVGLGSKICFIPDLAGFSGGGSTFDIAPIDDTANHSPRARMEYGWIGGGSLNGSGYANTAGVSIRRSVVMIVNIDFIFFTRSHFYFVGILGVVAKFANADEVTFVTDSSVIGDGIESRISGRLFVGVGCTPRWSPRRDPCPTEAKDG